MTEGFRYFLKVHNGMPYIPTSLFTVRKPSFVIAQKHIADCALHRSVVAHTAKITFTAFRFISIFHQRFVVVTVSVIYRPVWIEADAATQDTSECRTFQNVLLVRMQMPIILIGAHFTPNFGESTTLFFIVSDLILPVPTLCHFAVPFCDFLARLFGAIITIFTCTTIPFLGFSVLYRHVFPNVLTPGQHEIP